jgi:subtilisin family serine protease
MHSRKLMLIWSAVLALVLFAAAAGQSPGQYPSAKIDSALAERLAGEEGEKIPVIVILQGGDAPDLKDIDVRYRYSLIHGLAASARPSAIKKLAESGSVQSVYLDGSVYVDAPQSNASAGEPLIPARGIKAEKLWEKGLDGKGVVVAVIDSGIDKNHPDLEGKVVGEKNFVEDETAARDLLGHGTMVAGIIAGSGAASGGEYKGIAPGASLLNVKVIDREGNGRVSDIIAGIEWALYNGADVLSLSLGGINLGETNPPITMAADNAMEAGAVVCVAAGNRNNIKLEESGEGSSAASEPLVKTSQADSRILLVPIILALPPGLIDSPGDGVKVITLGASDADGLVADFSGSGPTRDSRTKPEVVAPGVNVVSAVPPGIERPDYIDLYYARESGTSLSTPVAAGLAALLLQAKPDLTPAGIKAAMSVGAEKLNNSLGEEYEEYYQGAGLLDASESFQRLSDDLCAVTPDKWIAGRWAYLPAGRGLYVGLDAGADRPQKKLYALAPQDEDWTNSFVFYSNRERHNLAAEAKGSIADWITLQQLPKSIPANGQKVFGASISVPKDALPGTYNGSIEITENDTIIFSIPVSVQVAAPLAVAKGRARGGGQLQGSQWHYYYLDVPLGTSQINFRLSWTQDSNLDLFLLAPTSEYYAGKQHGTAEDANVEYPASGRWLAAVHSEKVAVPVNYTLEMDRSLLESIPQRWSLDAASPGTAAKVQIELENRGLPLENLSYLGVRENFTTQDSSGSVGQKKIWETAVNVTPETKRIAAKISPENGNRSELLLIFEDPGGDPADAALGSGALGPVEVSRPTPGVWRLKVYGYDIPEGEQAFTVSQTQYAEELWTWIAAQGPDRIESDSNATLEASLAIPKNISVHRLEGYIEISSGNRSFEIPVSVAVKSALLEGIASYETEDSNKDGYFDKLSMDFGIDLTSPGTYMLEGMLTDCSGNLIRALSGRKELAESGTLRLEVNGSEIWKAGRCGPLRIKNLFLYDQQGDLLDIYRDNLTIERNPNQFQPPTAYLSGIFQNMTTAKKIAIGVGITVVRPGSYQLSARIVDDEGEELGTDAYYGKLDAGNATIVMEFNPTKFMMLRRSSHVHLVDLILKREEAVVDSLKDAWVSGEMMPRGAAAANNSLPGGIRWENGTVVIP